MKSYMGIDLGTHCGWARHDHGSASSMWSHGTWNCSITKFESPHIRFERFVREMRGHLAIGVDKVFFEAVRFHRGVDAAHIYGAFLTNLQAVCAEFDVPVEGLPVGTIKKFATGKGNASKDMMVAAARGWGFDPCDDNAADAIAILRCGMDTRT